MITQIIRAVAVSVVLVSVTPSVIAQGSEPLDYTAVRAKAEEGEALSQAMLGIMYSDGEGVPQDYVEAVKWYRKAADQGHVGAQGKLGAMYHFGQGVPQDYVKAVKWWRKAADQGNATAQFNLGRMYYFGLGIPQDYVQAHLWFNLAAAGGDKNAIKARGLIAAKMTPAQVAEAQKLAREWKPKKP